MYWQVIRHAIMYGLDHKGVRRLLAESLSDFIVAISLKDTLGGCAYVEVATPVGLSLTLEPEQSAGGKIMVKAVRNPRTDSLIKPDAHIVAQLAK